jgi:hypothetical protein
MADFKWNKDGINMKRLSIKNVSGLPLMLVLLAACATSPYPRVDAEFGQAVDMAKAQQTLNPDASLNTEPVVGIDGIASDAGFDNYRNSFINRPATTTGGTEFGSGGEGSSGGQ